ncbi:MAG TPA: hypothetical protein VI279_17040 [Rhodocyclaceae bacterium]
MKTVRWLRVLMLMLLVLVAAGASAARKSDISNTKHNLSATGPGTTKSTTESQICVFCHTPHGSDTSQAAPLWNKTLQNQTYTPFRSSSLDAYTIQGASEGQPLGSSKLCLSCHDGVMALGSVRVLRKQLNTNTGAGGDTAGSGSVVIQGGTQVTMPDAAPSSGYTRLLGTDLTNDHPISATYDSTLSDRDGELRRPDASQHVSNIVGVRGQRNTYKPLLPLEPTGASSAGQVQCTTCHDPHIRETDASTAGTGEGNIKFLRARRFQKNQPTSTFDATSDIICLSCHDKGMQGNGNTWAYSAHANKNVATATYKAGAATTRQFPKTGDTNPAISADLPVWKAACLNCHDTHTVSGARRLLREGTDATPGSALYLGGYKAGGSAALEETCYQCHNDSTNSIVTPNPPNIKQDFARTYRMRIRSADQPAAGTETHDVGGNFNDAGYVDCTTTTNKCGADLIESRAQLGNGNANNRHVECTDCHNPHRVVKFPQFYGAAGNITGAPSTATHAHTDATGYTHTNVASGVLRGSWGVEPTYTCCSFHTAPTGFTVRRGDPGADSVPNDSNADAKTYVTREYQVCLKCHSNYGYGTTPPNLDTDNSKGLTPAATGQTVALMGVSNGMTQYTNQAKEFQAPATHATESTAAVAVDLGTDAGTADANFNAKNHRSWHPVMRATGRTAALRAANASNWNLPWSNAVGTQTMYCSDCHGSSVTAAASVIPDAGNAWGPHGSSNPFILKGVWNGGASASATTLCFKCHSYNLYATRGGGSSGFGGSKDSNLHSYHADKIGSMRCNWCHVATPHGWKNKALLVNLNDVGEEAGQGAASSKEVNINGSSDYYTQAPYYLKAKLKVYSFVRSGTWADTNCGSRSKAAGSRINSTNGNASNNTNPATGIDWMKNTCSGPP